MHRLCIPSGNKTGCVFGGDYTQCTSNCSVGFPTGNQFCFTAECRPDFERVQICNADPSTEWNWVICDCVPSDPSPLLISGQGNLMELTSVEEGVQFDLNIDGGKERTSWTTADSEDAFLVLDRNGNGTIDDGRELFGNFTPQPASVERNGFLALAAFDSTDVGGDGDGWISPNDWIFHRLRLWSDRNHNGTSEPGELSSLANRGIIAISLDYKAAARRDRHGNVFRYFSFVRLNDDDPARQKQVVDVFLQTSDP